MVCLYTCICHNSHNANTSMHTHSVLMFAEDVRKALKPDNKCTVFPSGGIIVLTVEKQRLANIFVV